MSLQGLLSGVLLVLAIGLGFLYWRGHIAPSAPVVTTTPITDHYDITESDNGKTFSYSETSRFTVYLDSTKYSTSNLHCTPGGIVGAISNAPAVGYPLVAKRFEIVAPGTCKLSTDGFAVTIVGTGGY